MTLPKFWLDYFDSLTDRSKQLFILKIGERFHTQLRAEGMLKFIEAFEEEYKTRKKQTKDTK